MPRKIKNEFRIGAITAHVRKKANGVYEIRCQIQKEKIAVSSKNFDTAKEKFINTVNDLFANPLSVRINKHVKFNDYMQQWLETVKKPTVKANTFADYTYTSKTYIQPAFKDRELATIKGFEIQKFLNGFIEQGKNRTADKIYNLLTPIFEYATIDDIIMKSPMLRVSLPVYEQKHGTPFTRAEEKILIDKLKSNNSIYLQAYAFMIYTGVRRSELSSVEIDNGWIKIITSKQRKGLKEKTRSFPIPPMLKRILSMIDVNAIKAIIPDALTNHMKDYFKKHHTHDLRHTFITRCQECGIQREIVSLWAGHSTDNSQTTLVYTHLDQNREHQIEEMKKFDYPLN